ncbi:MAG: glycosyltransferase [Bacillota bacterium]|nr:glycosyltransferase [Bacillota bacterium]
MLTNSIKKATMALLFNVSDRKVALSYSIGILIGLLPLYEMRFIVIILASLVLGLNLITMFIGLGITVLCPGLYSMIEGMLSETGSIGGASLTPVFAGILIIPVIDFFTKIIVKRFIKDKFKLRKIAISAGVGGFVGYSFMYDLKIGFVVLIISIFISFVKSYKVLPLIAGAIPGILTFLLFKSVLSEQKLPIFLSGYQTLSDFIASIRGGHIEYFLNIVLYILVSASTYPIFKRIYSYNGIKRSLYSKLFIFQDSDGFRWSKLQRTSIVVTVLFILVTSIFVTGLFGKGPFVSGAVESKATQVSNVTKPRFDAKRNKNLNKTYCFYVDYDKKSIDSFKKNIDMIDVLVPSWYQLNIQGELVKNINNEVFTLANSNHVDVMPLVNNYINEKWDGNLIKRIISSKESRTNFINKLKDEAKKYNFCGFNIDFENLADDTKSNYTEFISELYSVFKANKLMVTVDVQPQKNAYDLQKLALNTDSIILMMYDEHSTLSGEGPIASQDWFEGILKSAKIPADKIIVGLGLFGYDWSDNNKNDATSMTVPDVMKLYKANKAYINWDKKSKNPTFKYNDGKSNRTLWFTDSIVAYNQIMFSQSLGIHQFSLWRLGSEDEKLWSIFNSLDSIKSCINELTLSGETLDSSDLTDTAILGEVVYQYNKSKIYLGKKLTTDSEGYIKDVTYNSKYIADTSENNDSGQKKIALTFDDGPNNVYTPKILDILKKNNIKASFFLIGKNAWDNPDIVKRMYKEGHNIGNHTYSHPDLPQYSRLKTRLELNMTNDIIEILTGHTTMLFRQPYNVDWDLSSESEASVFKEIEKMGYAIVGSNVDSKDWEGHSPEAIRAKINKDLGKGNIILLHDDSTNMKNMITALPLIINDLKAKGYSFETVSDLMNKSTTETMPSVRMEESAGLMTINLLLTLKANFYLFVRILFISATIIGVLRFIFLIFFATRQRKRHKNLVYKGGLNLKASVVVAAYNEEKVICKTVESILESDYKNLEVIVVNDGSKDNTAYVVEERFRDNKKVRLINKTNGGKSSAINMGFKEASGEIVIVIDADTILDSKAVSLLIRHFENENVAAVSGNVKVGNNNNFITTCQHIEYVTGLNLERRAFDYLNCIPVVPGAIGAWRKEYVKNAGYYKEDTLAEDADITLCFLEQGYKIIYEEGAKAYTEAPEDIESFLKQRLRWSYGTLQCLWKHRKSMFNRNNKILGFIALPNMWLYQFIFQALTPISEAVFLIGLFGKTPILSVLTYAIFFTIDFLITLYAFKLENEDTKPLKFYFFQRAAYRIIMTWVVYKSMSSALKGVKVGWNKLIRKGNVERQVQEPDLKEQIA